MKITSKNLRTNLQNKQRRVELPIFNRIRIKKILNATGVKEHIIIQHIIHTVSAIVDGQVSENITWDL